MKILIITDAWYPQINGVVKTLSEVGKVLCNQGHQVDFITPNEFKTFPCPSYPEIRLSWNTWKLGGLIRKLDPDAIHIATPEAPLGIAARCYCIWHKIPYTSSYHTKIPEYIHMRYPFIPEGLIYRFMRWAHKDSKAVLATTPTMLREMKEHKFKPRLVVWNRGVDYSTFKYNENISVDYKKTLVYVGRVSIEKNIEAFLKLKIPNTRQLVIGDGPAMKEVKEKYPKAIYVGYKNAQEIAHLVGKSSVFVFPSKTDTFGIVMIEAAACGTPIAAFPVTGPIDFVKEGVNGALSENLQEAIEKALKVSRESCYLYTKANYSWEKCAKIFYDTLAPIHKNLD
jgi:glycosyltransferase involved in cell wall biosynthesis